MSSRYHEPKVLDPYELEAGDQVGCLDMATRLTLVVPARDLAPDHADVIWLALWNKPADTKHVHGQPVPAGSVALQLGEQDWRVLPFPRVWGRRRVA